MKKQVLFTILMLLPLIAMADDSGSCGENVTYTFNELTKTLTISGNGKMDWFRIENGWGSNDKDTPWKPYQEEVLHVVIESNVTSIGEGSFWGCSNLQTVTIPSTVVECRNSSFKDCNHLEAVYITSLEAWCNIDFEMNGVSSNPLYYAHNLYLNGEKIVNLVVPEGISEIKTCTFCGFSEMTSLVIPNGLKTIGPSAFKGCNGLSSLTIPNSVTKIDASAFENCEGLTSIQLSDNLATIGSFAFGYCTALFSVVIPNSVTNLGDSSFSGCSGLSYVTLSNRLKSVGGFSDCTSLTTIDIPEGVETIYGGAFMRCTNLTSIKMPSTIKTVDMNAFSHCYKLKQIHIADIGKWCQISYSSWSDASLPFAASYGGHLYLNDEEITNLVIPDGVTSISANAFRYCIGIKTVKIPQSVTKIGESAFMNCVYLEEIELPENIQKLENRTFYGCIIKKLTIPSSVQYIYSQVFDGCNSLESVRVKAETPPFLNSTAFSNYNIPLYVPDNSVESYKNANTWSQFSPILPLSIADKYKLIYMVDGEVYKSYDVEYGATITPEAAPTKEGYTFSGWSEIPETMPAHDVTITGTFTKNVLGKCATPTIAYKDGKLSFDCETEDVTFCYSVTPPSSFQGEGNEVSLSNKYTISVYATKSGYENSDIVTQEIEIGGLLGDVNGDGIVDISDYIGVANIILTGKP